MDTQALSIWSMGAILALFVVFLVYENVGHKWKQSPSRPFVLGLFILLLGFIWHLFLIQQTSEMKTLVEIISNCKPTPCSKSVLAQTTSSNSIPFWKTQIYAYEAQAKFIELFLIPFAVSIVATALFVKADLSQTAREKDYLQQQKPLNERDYAIQGLELKLGERLAQGERGNGIIEEYEKLRNLRIHLTLDRIDLQREFKDILR